MGSKDSSSRDKKDRKERDRGKDKDPALEDIKVERKEPKREKESEDKKDRDRKRSRSGSKDRDRRRRSRDRDRSDRYRRKSRSRSPPARDNKDRMLDKFELYDAVNKSDELYATQLDPDETLEYFLEECSHIEEMIIKVYEARKNANSQAAIAALTSSDNFMEIQEESVVRVTGIRRLNRFLKLKLKISRDEVLKERQEADRIHLELQNLLYEALHLNKQIVAVKDYKSTDENIELVPIDQFYKEAPPNVTRAEVTQGDPHMLRIARLEYEFVQRQQLSLECGELEKEKEKVTQEIEVNKEKMESVKPILTRILDALNPAQEFFMPGHSERREMHRNSRYLPPNLYILHVSSLGHQEYLNKPWFKISIQGDVEAAKEQMKPPVQPTPVDSDSEMDADDPPDRDEPSERRNLRKHISVVEDRQDHAKKIMASHPLYLRWTLCDEKDLNVELLKIDFHFMTKLRIITVKTDLGTSNENEKFIDLLKSRGCCILQYLFKNDLGVSSPNPSTPFYLKDAGLTSFSELIPTVGHPYLWAQTLAGLEFSNLRPEYSENKEDVEGVEEDMRGRHISIGKIGSVFIKIERRLNCQSDLWNQLKNLENGTLVIPLEYKESFPKKNLTVFTSWETIDWKTFKSYLSTSPLVSSGAVKESEMFHRATLERGRARIIALVSLTLNYPDASPVFSLELDESTITTVDPCVFREVERELNIYCIKEFGKKDPNPNILSLQIQRLLYCIDISLETMSDDESVGPSEFAREKLYANRVRGKGFRRPFEYEKDDGGHFVHRY